MSRVSNNTYLRNTLDRRHMAQGNTINTAIPGGTHPRILSHAPVSYRDVDSREPYKATVEPQRRQRHREEYSEYSHTPSLDRKTGNSLCSNLSEVHTRNSATPSLERRKGGSLSPNFSEAQPSYLVTSSVEKHAEDS